MAVRTHNGRPLFKAWQTNAIMYWDHFWKINSEDSTTGWLYAVPGSDGQDPPTGEWKTHGYCMDDAGHRVVVRTDMVNLVWPHATVGDAAYMLMKARCRNIT